jgi:hypothetical protein
MTSELDELISDAVEDDYVSMVDFYAILVKEVGTGESVTLRAAELAAASVLSGRVVPGFLGADFFRPWSTTPAESARRIEEYAAQLIIDGGEVTFGEPCWFDSPLRSGDWGEPCSPDSPPWES